MNVLEVLDNDRVKSLLTLFRASFGDPNSPTHFEDKIASSTSLVIALDSLKGFVTGCKLSERTFFVEALAVDNSVKRRGYGRSLLEKIERVAAERFSSTSVALQVEPDNIGAIALYTKLGYQVITETTVMNLMAKSLDGSELPSNEEILIATFNIT